MHILFIHHSFPNQFSQIAGYLVQKNKFRCTVLSEDPPGFTAGIEKIQFQFRGGATEQNNFCTRTFENVVCRSIGAFEALQARPDIQPDLIVAHSGFLSSVFLRELYECPIINYFEYYYHTTNSDMDFRLEFCGPLSHRLRARARNSILLLDLENCDVGYCPTLWQRERFPPIFLPKLRTIFDGIDTSVWRPQKGVSRIVGGQQLPDNMRIVTYVSRGMESMRGFDLFMKAAKVLCDRRSDVMFVVVGEDRVCYGSDQDFTGGMTFKEWVLSQDQYDRSRFLFAGRLPPLELVNLFAISDLHIYLTVPFVLSWSLMNALACGTTVLASNTAPVQEMIIDGQNGLLTDFFDFETMARRADEILDDPLAFRHLGQSAVRHIQENYSLDVCLPRMLSLYEEAFNNR